MGEEFDVIREVLDALEGLDQMNFGLVSQVATEQRISSVTAPTGLFQRAEVNPSPAHAVPSIVHEVVRSPGQPLDDATRSFMEPHFGHDFSRVRVHTDSKATESARAVNALAYTVGHDVVFGCGQYAPRLPAGEQLLAHELTHVVQQRQSRGRGI